MIHLPFASVQPFIEYATSLGLVKSNILTAANIDEEAFERCEGTLTMRQYDKLLYFVQKRLEDELLGVRYGLYLNLQALGVIYQISMSCDTLKQAIGYLQEYSSQVFPAIAIQFYEENGEAYLLLSPDKSWGNERAHHHSLVAMSLLVYREIHLMLRNKESVVNLIIPHETIFAQSLSQNRLDWKYGDSYGVSFPKEFLELSLSRNLKGQLEVLILEYQKFLESITAGDQSFEKRVKHHILHQMGMGRIPQVDEIAFQLNLSKRSFQRKLRMEGMTYRAILEGLLKTLSKKMLRHRNLSVQDISYMLGYAEPSAFIHAYQRWFQVAPNYSRKS